MGRYVADFETTTKEEDCRVWHFALCEIETEQIRRGLNLDDFMELVQNIKNPTIYFHNLKFDGEFILAWLFNHGFNWVKDKKDLQTQTFTTLISDKGAFYSMEIIFKRHNKNVTKITVLDSLKLLPFSVEEIARGFKLPIQKLDLDYTKDRPIGYVPDQAELSYIDNDVLIVAKALKVLFNEGLTKMTIGSNALENFKQRLGSKFDGLFPVPHYDEDIRQSYKGGFTYLNPKYANKVVQSGIVLDVNSLYPSVMKLNPMPYGEPLYFEGEYKPDKLYNLYVILFTCQFELKENHIPTIQLKNNLAFIPTEYITTSEGEDTTLCLTSVDFDLFKDHYNVYNIEYEGGWKFKSCTGVFDDYIDDWNAKKMQSKIDGNHAMYTLSKLMLNNLYGKFSLNPNSRSKIPWLENGIVKYTVGEEEKREAVYLPVGTFITAWARNITIRSAQKLYDRFIYADTDSLHLEGLDVPEDLTIDPYTLGAWKHESNFKTAKFIRAKTYLEVASDPDKDEYKMKITCAGMPKTCYQFVTFENFKQGSRYGGKLVPKHVVNGIILKTIDFTINRDKMKVKG